MLVGHAAQALAFLRTRVFELWVLLYSCGFGLVIVTYLQIRRRPREVRWLLRLWSRIFIGSARAIMGVRYRILGLETVPKGPVLLVANHQSYWESIALTALVPDVNVISKSGAMRIPVFGWGLRHAPMIAIDRATPGRNLRRMLTEGVRSVAEGRSILLFPEGTRVPPGETRRHSRGVGTLHARLGVPLVPVVTDAGAVWPAGFEAKHPGEVTLAFLPAIPPGGDPETVAHQVEVLLNAEKERLPGARGSVAR